MSGSLLGSGRDDFIINSATTGSDLDSLAGTPLSEYAISPIEQIQEEEGIVKKPRKNFLHSLKSLRSSSPSTQSLLKQDAIQYSFDENYVERGRRKKRNLQNDNSNSLNIITNHRNSYEEFRNNNNPTSHRSFDLTAMHRSLSSTNLLQPNLTYLPKSISSQSISTTYTVRKKETFSSVLPQLLQFTEDERNDSVFFDLEKTDKHHKTTQGPKKNEKIKKKVLSLLYKSSTLYLICFGLSIMVLFFVALSNALEDTGFYTNGSPTSLFIVSGLYFILCITFIAELHGALVTMKCYSIHLRSTNRKQINLDGTTTVFLYRLILAFIFFVVSFMNWVCYGLVPFSRDHLSGWVCFFGIISVLCFGMISYNQYIAFRKENYADFESEAFIQFNEIDFTCCVFGTIWKTIVLFFFTIIFGGFLLFTIQSVSLTVEHVTIPGEMVELKMEHHSYKIHLLCKGTGNNLALMDADIGIPSAITYWSTVQDKLAANGVRACVLERSGYGFSDTGALPRDSNRTVAEIVDLIFEARLRTPLVFIAHSFSTFTARLLNTHYPQLVSGMLLLHPAHELQEEILLKQVYNLTNTQIVERTNSRDYINNVLRLTTPFAISRLFDYFQLEFLFPYDDPYELYYMNGYKTYMNYAYTESQKTLNRVRLFKNQYSQCVWSELRNFQKSAVIVRQSRTNETFSEDVTPVTVLTSQYLIDGTCEQNNFNHTRLCENFLKRREPWGNAIKYLHSEIAKLYPSSEWHIVPASYDIALDLPNTVVKYTLELFAKTPIH
ncbi:hypothetical protein ABK040_001829 [Willaertia magna]